MAQKHLVSFFLGCRVENFGWEKGKRGLDGGLNTIGAVPLYFGAFGTYFRRVLHIKSIDAGRHKRTDSAWVSKAKNFWSEDCGSPSVSDRRTMQMQQRLGVETRVGSSGWCTRMRRNERRMTGRWGNGFRSRVGRYEWVEIESKQHLDERWDPWIALNKPFISNVKAGRPMNYPLSVMN